MALPVQSHPAADLFPMMSEADLSRLAESIRQQGLIEPIVTHEDMILDGRNRLKACGLAGASARFVKWDGAGGSPTQFAVLKNLNRRHLTHGQQSAVGAEMLPLLEEEARKRQATNKGLAPDGNHLRTKLPEGDLLRSRTLAAKAVGVGESSVHRAAAVKEADPEAFERIKRGETKVNTEYQRVVLGREKRERKPPALSLGIKEKKPPVFTGKRLSSLQGSNFRRVAEAIGSIGAHVGSLERVNLAYVVGASNGDEIAQWMRAIDSCVAQLRNFKKSLERAKNEDGGKNGSTKHSGEGFEDSSDGAARATPIQVKEYREQSRP